MALGLRIIQNIPL